MSPQEEQEEKKAQAQIYAIYMASIFVCLVPLVIYVGDIYCKQNHLEPPSADLLMKCCLAGVGAIITFGFPGIPSAVMGVFKKILDKKKE